MAISIKPLYQSDFNKLFSPMGEISERYGKYVPKIMEQWDLCTGKKEFIAKKDATYLNNPMLGMVDGFFRINPRQEDPLLKEFGTIDLRGFAINQKYIQFETMVAKSAISVSDDLRFVHGSSKNYPAWWKAKIFQFGVALKELDFRAMQGGQGFGSSLITDKVATEIQASRGRMTETLLQWFHGYTTTFTSDVEADPHWRPALAAKGTTGTASNPEDLNSTPGTVNTYAKNLTGSNKSRDFVLNTIGIDKKLYTAQRDSITGERLLKRSGNTYLMLAHPDAIDDLNTIHPNNGVQDDMNVTIGDQIRKKGIRMIESYETDAAYANTEDGTVVYQLLANVKDNFKIGMVSDLVIEDWMSQVIDGVLWFTKRAWMKALPFARPYFISGSWKKAMTASTFVYVNDV